MSHSSPCEIPGRIMPVMPAGPVFNNQCSTFGILLCSIELACGIVLHQSRIAGVDRVDHNDVAYIQEAMRVVLELIGRYRFGITGSDILPLPNRQVQPNREEPPVIGENDGSLSGIRNIGPRICIGEKLLSALPPSSSKMHSSAVGMGRPREA